MSMPTPPQQPSGPPPGYPPQNQLPNQTQGQREGPPPGYGPPTQVMSQQQPGAKTLQLVWVLGLVSVLGVALGLSLKEDGTSQWHIVNAWGGLAIAGAVLTLAPAVARSLGLTAQRAWQIAVCGAGALVLFWVLFTLPSVGSNLSLLTTIGVAAGLICAWIAPGREPSGPQRPTW